MPEPDESRAIARRAGQLNESQQRRLRVSCEYVDKLLADIDDVLHASTSESPFPRYQVDVNPAQIRVLEDYIRRIRSQLLHTIAWQDLRPEPPDIPASRAVTTNLAFIDIAIEELRPKYMKGFGAVPDDAVAELNGIVHELRSLAGGMEGYLKQELGTNLEKRLEKLENTGYDVVLLRLLEQVIFRNGLVEFRNRITLLTTRLEDDGFEVALFGRVSSGKSSLLNALLGTSALPVGITPITAVPTKIRFGAALRAAVSYGDGRSGFIALDEFRRVITEQGNPGNTQNIVRALLEVPSSRLKEGILLVDTPGLGSLAKRGAAETLAYLPSCDLALLLIDAGATLNEEDIDTLRLLYEAGIPALVLLSKADVLAPGDLHQAIAYIEQQVKRELSLKVTVHAVSALPHFSVMLDQFYERELVPRFQEARTLREASVSRKIGALRDAVKSVLGTFLHREKHSTNRPSVDISGLESSLRVVAGEVGEQRTVVDRAFREIGERPSVVLDRVAERAVLWVRESSENKIPPLQLAEWIHEVIWALVQSPVDELKGVGERAIGNLQRVASEMGRTDVPTRKDFDLLLRDMPRFELAALPSAVSVSHWKFLGEAIIRSRIRTRLRESVGGLLKEELHQYGLALSQWGEQLVKKLDAVVNSYADAYRMQLHRIAGAREIAVNVTQAEQDLTLLDNWEFTNRPEFAGKGA